MPKVSVVIPTKGRPALLMRAIDSVLAQTMADVEVVVVIDGHDPETTARLATVTDRRVRVCQNATSRGSGKARNIGAWRAEGDWIAFLDDDDVWLPRKLERQLAACPGVRRVIVTCLSAFVTPLGTTIRPREPFSGQEPIDEWLFDRRRLFGGGAFLQTSSLLMPRELFLELGFPGHSQHEDWEFAIRAVKFGGISLLTVPEDLVRHHAEEERPSLSQSGTVRRSLEWIDRMRGAVTQRAYSGFCLTVIAHHAARNGDWRIFMPLLVRAFRFGRPTGLQLAVYLLTWFMPRKLHKLLRRLRPLAGTGALERSLPAGGETA